MERYSYITISQRFIFRLENIVRCGNVDLLEGHTSRAPAPTPTVIHNVGMG